LFHEPGDGMQRFSFGLDISAEKYLRYYQGNAKSVVVVTDDGLTLKFPANNLQKYVTRDGIHGRFEIDVDEDHKIVAFRKTG
jgi:hypothetical protein